MSKKIIFLLMLSSTAQAGGEYILPKGYSFGFNPRNEILELIELSTIEDRKIINYATKANHSDDNDLWLTMCSRSLYKGIPETKCEINKDNFQISVTNKKPYQYIVYFDYKTAYEFARSKNPNLKRLEKETNYKIDNLAIRTLPMIAIVGSYDSNALVRDAIKGQTLYYSIKNNEDYKSYKLNLIGLKESVDFANKFISINK